jgi:hypothetical protein
MKPNYLKSLVEITGKSCCEKNDAYYFWVGNDEDSVERPTEEQLAQAQSKYDAELAEYEAKQYQRDRVYPSIEEQLDMQYWDSVNGTTTWADAIAAVKAANPKPE